MEVETMNALKKLCLEQGISAVFSCKAIHELAMEAADKRHTGNEDTACMGYIGLASSQISVAEALYRIIDSEDPHWSDPTTEKTFGAFRLFIEEYLTDFKTGHSYQHVAIYFNELMNLIADSLFEIRK